MPQPSRAWATSSAFDILYSDTSQQPTQSGRHRESHRGTRRHSSGRHHHHHDDDDWYGDLQQTVHETRRPRPDVTGSGAVRPCSRPLAARQEAHRHRGDASDEDPEAELPSDLRGPAREVARSVKDMVRRVMMTTVDGDEADRHAGFDEPDTLTYEQHPSQSHRNHNRHHEGSRVPHRSEPAGSRTKGGRVHDPTTASGFVGVSTRLAHVSDVSPAPPTRFGASSHLATRSSGSSKYQRRVVPDDELSPVESDGDIEHEHPHEARRADPAAAASHTTITSASGADLSGADASRQSSFDRLAAISARHSGVTGGGYRAGRSASADGAATRQHHGAPRDSRHHRHDEVERHPDTPHNTSSTNAHRRTSEPANTVPAADFARLEGEAAAVNREADRLRAQLEERDGEVASLRASLAEAREEVFRAKHDAQIAKSEHADALTALQMESSKEKQRLLDEALQAKREAADSSVRVRDLMGQQDRCAAAEADLERAQLQLENEQLSRKETSRELDIALAESKRRAGEIEVCRSELAVARDQLRALEAEANGLRDQLHSARDESADRVREIADERDTVRRDAESIVATAQDHIAAANAKLKEKKQTLRDLRDALDRERSDAAAAAESYEAECERLERRASVAEREVAQERQSAADAAERQTIAEAALRELEQRTGAAQASSVADYEAKLRQADNDVVAAQREVVAAKAGQREAERRADATDHEREREMAAKNAAQAEVQRLRGEVERLGNESVPRSAQQRAEELESALATSKSHAQALQRQLDGATKDLATTQADLQRLRGAVRALKGSNRSMDHELDSVRDIVASSQRDSSVSSVNASSGHIGSALNASAAGHVGSSHRSVSAPASSAAGPVHVPARAVATEAGPGRMAVRTHSPSTTGTPRHAPAAAPHHHQTAADDPNASIGSVQSRVSFASSVPVPKGHATDSTHKPQTPPTGLPRTLSARTPPSPRKTTPLAQAETASSSARRRSAQRRTPSPIGSAASSGASSASRRAKGSTDAEGRRRVESVLNGFAPALQALRPRQSSRSASADSAARPTAQSATAAAAAPAAHHHRAQPRRVATPFDQSSSDGSSSASSDGLARMVERAWGSARSSR